MNGKYRKQCIFGKWKHFNCCAYNIVCKTLIKLFFILLNLLKYKEKTKKVKKMKKDVDNVEDICYIINALEKNKMQK